MKLNEEQIRIKVAELCGWTVIDCRPEFICGKSFFASPRDFGGTPPEDKYKEPDEQAYRQLPNYPRDLNACAEIEATLDDIQWKQYVCEHGGRDTSWLGGKRLLSASALQRCLAFLRTHGIDAEVYE